MVTRVANEFGVNWKILIAQIINFAIVAFLLYRFAFKPILATLDERQKKIAEGLKFSEEMEQELRNAEREREATLAKASLEGKNIISEAREKAKEFLEEQAQNAIGKADAIVKKAEETIAHEKQLMLNDLRKELGALVLDATSKVLSKELSAEEKNRFSEAATKELQTEVAALSGN